MYSTWDLIESLAKTYEGLDDYAKEDVILRELAEWTEEEYNEYC